MSTLPEISPSPAASNPEIVSNQNVAAEVDHQRPLVTDTTFGSRLMSGLAWLPSLLVVSAIVAIFWFGHRNDWKLPSIQATSAVTERAWCESHGVPEDDCIVCRPDLIEKTPQLSFCQQHGVHGCVLCNPSLAETKVPTEPSRDDLERAERALALRPRKENLPSSSAGSRIQFASIDAMKKAGVDVDLVQRQHVVESISASCEVVYDATETADVSPRANGIVRRILVELGDWVTPGQVLAVIDSTEVGRLKTDLSAALSEERLCRTTVERLRPLVGEAIAGKRLLEAENELQQATAVVNRAAASLGNLGVNVDLTRLRQQSDDQARAYIDGLGLAGFDLAEFPRNKNLIAVVAPLEGQVVQRKAMVGQVVDRGSELFRIVDTRSMWLDLRVPAEEAPLVKLGQNASFLPDGRREKYSGTITWISSEVDPQTRTVRVRAELANPNRQLRNESFGQGRVILREEPDAIVVPETALAWDGSGQVVFVRDARFFEEGRPKFFNVRSVRTGVRQDGAVEIIAGVLPGEVVATDGSDVLRAQLLRSKLGAGCTCGH